MSGCQDCKWLIAEQKVCGIEKQFDSRSPIRNCIIAINQIYITLPRPGQRVLEIGCGAWSPVADSASKCGYEWVGFDVSAQYMGRKTIAGALASVEFIPFAAKTFDWVVANQSLEHWEENRVNLQKGLSEVFRVLKPGGWALMNVPIHLHGSPEFVLGDLPSIQGLFEPFSDEVRLEPWRHPHAPLPAYRPVQPYYGMLPAVRDQSTFILDIRARRRTNPPYFDSPPEGRWSRFGKEFRYYGIIYYPSILMRKLLARRSGRGLDGAGSTGHL